jgi:hypothetical protein
LAEMRDPPKHQIPGLRHNTVAYQRESIRQAGPSGRKGTPDTGKPLSVDQRRRRL